MYIENYDFKEWMQKLFDKLDELCKDVRILCNADKVLPEDDNLLDNQDLSLLFKVSIRTLQRLRSKNKLPYMLISGKVYCSLISFSIIPLHSTVSFGWMNAPAF